MGQISHWLIWCFSILMVSTSLRILICILRSGITKLKIFPVRWELQKDHGYRYEKQFVRGTEPLNHKVPRLMIRKTWGYKNTIWTVLRPWHWNPLQISLYWDTVVGSEIRLSKHLSFLTYHISLFSRLMHPFGSAVTPGSSSPSFMMVSFTQTTSTKKTWRKVATTKLGTGPPR